MPFGPGLETRFQPGIYGEVYPNFVLVIEIHGMLNLRLTYARHIAMPHRACETQPVTYFIGSMCHRNLLC